MNWLGWAILGSLVGWLLWLILKLFANEEPDDT